MGRSGAPALRNVDAGPHEQSRLFATALTCMFGLRHPLHNTFHGNELNERSMDRT